MSQSDVNRCPHCLHELAEGAQFCPYCGREPVIPPHPKELSLLWPLLLIVIIPLVACGGCVLDDSGESITIAIYVELLSICLGIAALIIRYIGRPIP